nr:Wzz/FepE/Etk N-terminal domain-containing protein [uncultured Caldimonas sp.]
MNENAVENSSPPAESGIADSLLVLVEHLRVVVLLPLLVGIAAYGASFLVPPTYTAKTLLLPPQYHSSAAAAAKSLGVLANLANIDSMAKSQADRYIGLMQSANVMDRLIDEYALEKAYGASSKAEARRRLSANTTFSTGKKDGLISIEVDDTDPVRAAAIANSYVGQLRALTAQLASDEVKQRREFFARELSHASGKLAEAARSLNGSTPKASGAEGGAETAAEAYSRLRAEVAAGEVRLLAMRDYVGEQAPEYQNARSSLERLRKQLNEVESAAKGDSVDSQWDRYDEFQYQAALFDLFASQYESARLDESREGTLVQVVDVATPPERQARPKRASIAILAMLVAFAGCVTLVLARAKFRRVMSTPDGHARLHRLRTSLRRSLSSRAN